MRFLREARLTGGLVEAVEENYFRTLLILFSAIVMSYLKETSHVGSGLKFFIPFFLLFLCGTAHHGARTAMLAVVLFLLTIGIVLRPYEVANHAYFITYICGMLFIASCAYPGEGDRVMQRGAMFLLSILMGLALIQKVGSVYYMQGNLIGDYILSGLIFKNLLSVIYPDFPQTIEAIKTAKAQLSAVGPNGVEAVAVEIPPGIRRIIMQLTYTSLISQAALELCIIFYRKLGVWTHYAILLFVLIIYSTRDENVFLSMNCILGYALTDESTKKVRILYVLWIFYLLGTSLTGVRPGLFS